MGDKGGKNMDMDRIYESLTSNNINSLLKKQTREITEADIFVDDNDDFDMINTENTFDITEEDIFGEDIGSVNLICRISKLEKENLELRQQNWELQQQVKLLHESIQNECSPVQENEKLKPPAYRDDIDLDKLVTLYKSGVSRNKIGKALKCSSNTVKNRLKELGIL